MPNLCTFSEVNIGMRDFYLHIVLLHCGSAAFTQVLNTTCRHSFIAGYGENLISYLDDVIQKNFNDHNKL